MKKRLFSALLALCIVLTALPLTGLTAFAATQRGLRIRSPVRNGQDL